MRMLAIAGNLLLVALVVWGAMMLGTPVHDSVATEFDTQADDLTPPGVVVAYALAMGMAIISPCLLALYALVRRSGWAVAFAGTISGIGAVGGGLISALGLLIWLPAYLQGHFSDEGGAAGGIMMMAGLPLALFCSLNFLALRAIRRESGT